MSFKYKASNEHVHNKDGQDKSTWIIYKPMKCNNGYVTPNVNQLIQMASGMWCIIIIIIPTILKLSNSTLIDLPLGVMDTDLILI